MNPSAHWEIFVLNNNFYEDSSLSSSKYPLKCVNFPQCFCQFSVEICQFSQDNLHWEKIKQHKYDTCKRVIGILVNWHISTGILTIIACYPHQNICVEMYQFTRIPMTRLKHIVFMLLNFSQWGKLRPEELLTFTNKVTTWRH